MPLGALERVKRLLALLFPVDRGISLVQKKVLDSLTHMPSNTSLEILITQSNVLRGVNGMH
jgi:hypothetical protein